MPYAYEHRDQISHKTGPTPHQGILVNEICMYLYRIQTCYCRLTQKYAFGKKSSIFTHYHYIMELCQNKAIMSTFL